MIKSWNSRTRWSFPKGKIAKNESLEQCAIREVHEEIGFDISGLLDPQKALNLNSNGNSLRLYVIIGVDESTPFAPVSRKEISDICWHSLYDISTNFDSPFYAGHAALFTRLFKLISKLSPLTEPIPQGESFITSNSVMNFMSPTASQGDAAPPNNCEETLDRTIEAFYLKLHEFFQNYPSPFSAASSLKSRIKNLSI